MADYKKIQPKQVSQFQMTPQMNRQAMAQGLQQHIIPFAGGLYAAAGSKVAPYITPHINPSALMALVKGQ